MAKPSTPRTDSARPSAEQVDPIIPNPTDASEDAQTAPSDAPNHDAEQSRGGSTPKPQNGNTLYPDGNTKPDEKAMKASGDAASPSKPDPLLIEREDERPLAGATAEVEVKTTGDFVLMDPFTGKHFNKNETTSTPCTQWVQDQIDAGRLA